MIIETYDFGREADFLAENNTLLERLFHNFDDFKERLIRIEEGVKDVSQLKVDVGEMKVQQSKIDESTKSSHKRLDDLERKVGQVLFWAATTVIGGLILGLITYLFAN